MGMYTKMWDVSTGYIFLRSEITIKNIENKIKIYCKTINWVLKSKRNQIREVLL